MEINKFDDYTIEVFFNNKDLEKYDLELGDLMFKNKISDEFYVDAMYKAYDYFHFSWKDILTVTKIKEFNKDYFVYKIILNKKI